MNKDEYDQIYRDAPVGFLFRVTPSYISRSVPLAAEQLCEHPPLASNPDELYLFCKPCDVYMYFCSDDEGSLDGKWVCPGCGRTVMEATIYRHIEKENERFRQKLRREYGDNDAF